MIEDEIPEAVGSVPGHNIGTMLEDAKNAQSEALRDKLFEGKTFAQRRSEFLASAARQVVRDRQSAGDAGDTIKLAGEVWAMIEKDRKERSGPYYEAHRAINSMAVEFWEPVVEAMAALKRQIDAWTAEEDKRIAEQQREQEAEMARMRAKAAPVVVQDEPDAYPGVTFAPEHGRAYLDYTAPATAPPAPPQPSAPAMKPAHRSKIRGDLGAMITAADVTTYEIEDFSLLPAHILQSPTVKEAILTVVAKTAKHMGVPPGIRVITATANRIR